MATIASLSRNSSAVASSASADAVRHDDSRMSDARTPLTHSHAEGDITNLGTDLGNKVATDDARVTADQAAATASIRTLGAGAAQAAAGNHAHAAYVATSRQVVSGTGLSGGGDLTADRTLVVSYGTSSTTACVGNDSRLSDSRAPNGTAGGCLNGSYPNPALDVVPWAHVDLVDASPVATDASLGNHFRVAITADRTLGVPTNPTDGQRCIWEVNASGGARTLALTTGSAGAFAFGSDITALSQIASGKTDFIGAIYNSTASRWYVIAYVKGY